MTEMDAKEQLLYLKGMTVRFGSVHEAQLLQIRNYPLLVPGATSAVTEFDIENKVVVYKLGFSAGSAKVSPELLRAMSEIVKWVRTVLWDDTQVAFLSGKRKLYDTRKSAVSARGRRRNAVRNKGNGAAVPRRSKATA